MCGRNKRLIAGSAGGAENAAILCRLVVSCKLAGVDPFACLRDVWLRIHNHPSERIGELVPREWKSRFCLATAPQTQSAT